MVTSSVRVRSIGRRLRGANLGRTVRTAAPGAPVLQQRLRLQLQPRAPAAQEPGVQGSERQREVQGYVPGNQSRQLRVPGTNTLSVGSAVPVLKPRLPPPSHVHMYVYIYI